LTKKLIEHSIYCISDIETSKWSNEIDSIDFKLMCLIVYNAETDKEIKRYHYQNQTSILMLLKNLYFMNNKRKPILYYHNLAFDYRFLHTESLSNRKSINILFAHSKVLRVITNYVEFRDSLSILTMSVDRLGKNITNYQKMNMENDDLIEYCFRDIEIVQKSLVSIAHILNKRIIDLCLSIASESRKIFDEHNFNYLDRIYNQPTEKINGFDDCKYDYRLHFFGGRCSVYSYEKQKHTIVVDCNSLYTKSMSANVYPLQPYTFTNKINDSNLTFAYLIDVTEQSKYPLLPIRQKNKSVDYINARKKVLVSNKTFDYIKNHRDSFIIHEILEQHECSEFINCFSYLKEKYNQRLHFKEIKDLLSDNSTKILLNAGYGKFAEKQRTHDFTCYNKHNLSVDEYIEITDNNLDFIQSEDENQICVSKEKYMKKKNNLVFAFLICDYSRLYIQQNLMDIAQKNDIDIYYTDTDSGFTEPEIQKYINMNETELGAFKNEFPPYLDWFKAIDKKEYISSADKYIKAKGLDSKNITIEQKIDYMNHKPVQLSRPMSLKLAFKDNLPLNSVSHVTKQKRKKKI
jgi:hypothetical protein